MKAQLNLEFKDFPSFVMGVFEEIFESNCFNDIELMGDDNIPLKAHKAILSSFSSTLREYMNSKQILQKLHVSGVNYHDLKSLLQFVYLGEVNVARENLEKFFAIAEFLGIEQLQDQCTTNHNKGLGQKFTISTDINFKTTETQNAEDSTDVNKECSKVENESKEENQIQETEDYIVGKPSEGFNIFNTVLYSHNYYRILKTQEGSKRGSIYLNQSKIVICLMCLRGPEKKKKLWKVGDSTTSGLNRHLHNQHPEFSEQFIKQKAEINHLRNEKKAKTNITEKVKKDKEPLIPRKTMKCDYEWFSQSPGKIVNIKAKVLFTQGYFERVMVRKGGRSYKGARCLNCSDGDPHSKLGIYKFIQGDHMTQDLRKHLRTNHGEVYAKFLLQESNFIDQQVKANEKINPEIQNEYLADIEDIEVGEVEPGYDFKEHVIFSHNFFRRIPVEKNGFPEDHAACLICVKLGGKTLLQIGGNSNSGLKKHLANKHPEHFNKYENVSKLFKEMKRNKFLDVIIPDTL